MTPGCALVWSGVSSWLCGCGIWLLRPLNGALCVLRHCYTQMMTALSPASSSKEGKTQKLEEMCLRHMHGRLHRILSDTFQSFLVFYFFSQSKQLVKTCNKVITLKSLRISVCCVHASLCFEWSLLNWALHAYSNSCHLDRGGDETTWVTWLLIMKETNCGETKRIPTSSERYRIWEDVSQMSLRKDVSAADKPFVRTEKPTENTPLH